MLSDRSALSNEEPTALDRALAERRARGGLVLDLTRADPELDEGVVRDAVCAPPGDPHLAIARRLETDGVSIDPAHIVLSAGRADAYARLVWLLCDRGDEILVPQPSLPRLERVAQDHGVMLAPYPLRFEDRWRVDPAAIWDAVGERTRAIVVESPSAPAGCYLHADALEALASLELPLIVDESWAAYPLEADAQRARASDATTFTIDGLSALPEMKLSWIGVTGAEAPVAQALDRLSGAPSSIAAPIARALPALLESEPRRAVLERARRNLATLRSIAPGTRLEIPPIEGGWHAALRLGAGDTGERWAMRLLDRGVLVTPGSVYDMPDRDAWLVISLVTPAGELARGIEILADIAR